jgi:hypothetical protein
MRTTSKLHKVFLGLWILVPGLLWAGSLAVPTTFVAGTPISADAMNANFAAVQTAVNSKQDLVTGTCGTGSAIRAIDSAGNVTCEPIPPSGPTTAAFIHISSAANSAFDYTLIDHPSTNNNPNAIVVATHNWTASQVYYTKAYGVFYTAGKWAIYNDDGSNPFPASIAFNVMVVTPP